MSFTNSDIHNHHKQLNYPLRFPESISSFPQLVIFSITNLLHLRLFVNKNSFNIALVGNPNSGKTSLFNLLTGLNQKVGNFPGVTVDKKTGTLQINEQINANLIDLPGTYSLYPRRSDEWVAYKVLMHADGSEKPDIIILVADASNLKRNLLFCSQILDLKIPVMLVLTMNDIATSKGIIIDIEGLQKDLGVPVVAVNPRKNKGVSTFKKVIAQLCNSVATYEPKPDFIDVKSIAAESISELQQLIPDASNYRAIHYLINHENFPLSETLQEEIENVERRNGFNPIKTQADDVLMRYQKIRELIKSNVVEPHPEDKKIFTDKIDNVLLHRFWGYLILLTVLFTLFQSVFWLAQYPMDWIEAGFNNITNYISGILPETWWSNLFTKGILAGLSGIVVFVPQIMILFGLITILEDSGYMARISFLSDKLMRKTGLNGKSLMPMISGFACAVPAIMTTRNIENKKERLLTILITPLMSCSARLPVFTILISLSIENKYYFGFLSLQGLVMMGLYLTGIVGALVVSTVISKFIHIKEKSFFILELPIYRMPQLKNIYITMFEKVKVFIMDAGKIIMMISLVLWFLSSYGPGNSFASIEKKYNQEMVLHPLQKDSLQRSLSSEKLKHSYAGIMGKTIEPAIKPLGFDWKIGIALISSFAAREVFVGTMATLYSVEENNKSSLREKMQAQVDDEGKKVYSLATSISLMMFYLFAMQCMSTLAVVKRETKSWKWPVFQFAYMTFLAYTISFITFHLLR